MNIHILPSALSGSAPAARSARASTARASSSPAPPEKLFPSPPGSVLSPLGPSIDETEPFSRALKYSSSPPLLFASPLPVSSASFSPPLLFPACGMNRVKGALCV